jgi:hypothetical protein
MTERVRADDIHRTALLGAYDDSQPTLDAALMAYAATGVLVCANEAACVETSGQVALLTAVVTAVRAFGQVHVLASTPDAPVAAGVARGLTLAEAIGREGAQLVSPSDLAASDTWPVVLIGAGTPAPTTDNPGPVLRISWSGWVARVSASGADEPKPNGRCVLAAIAAAAMGISEAFNAVRARAGSDAGFRTVELNLWNPNGSADDEGPGLAHAPRAWWLVGLGHLGQAYAWVISWLEYEDLSAVEIVLQDTDRTVPANHSTGVLTPRGSTGTRKTRLVAESLKDAGFDTRILERRLGTDLRADDDECHVALLGVDNLRTRRLTSGVGWLFTVDVGLGSGPTDFSSLLLRRFPGARSSGHVEAWDERSPHPVTVPSSRAFADLLRHGDECGVVELAGKAVGASFVGVVAACLAVAEASRELHGGTGLDILTFDLTTTDLVSAVTKSPANVISTPLRLPDRASS